MRRITALLLFLPALSFSQLTFTEHIIDTASGILGISKVVPADFNNDGQTDIATVKKTANELAFYIGNGTSFGARQVIPSSLDFPVDICAADLNGDGLDDLISIELQGHAVQIFLNQTGGFSSGQKIDSNVFFAPVGVFAADFTNDSIPDLLTVDDTVVYMYENDGNANFTRHKVAGQTEFYSAGIADINGDSLPDILLGSVRLYTYINTGNGNFTRDTRNEPLINDFIFEIELADMDQDGDNDAAVYYSNTNPNIDWYANDGTGKFSMGGTVTSTANDVHSMRFGDFNDDGFPDFLTGYGQTGDLIWIKNTNGSFGSETTLKTYSLFTREMAVADTDMDGDLDIFCGHFTEGLFLWENLSPHFTIAENDHSLEVYPNPSSGSFRIKNQQNSNLKIYNLIGNYLFQTNVSSANQSINPDLPKGTYILQLTQDGNSFSQKLLIR